MMARSSKWLAILLVGAWQSVAFAAVPAKPAWSHDEAAAIAAAKKAHQPVLVDFFAEWCLPCKELDVKVFADAEVAAEMQRFQLIKADCTADDDPPVVERMKRYNVESLPTVLLIDSTGKIVERLVRVPEPKAMLEKLKRVH
jgi:thioredoxin:protein disulfide reductase